jgi:hypothetical protein
MQMTEKVIDGTIRPDGTLVLDEKPNLPPGRVKVLLRQEVAAVLPTGAAFWQRMHAMWAIPRTGSGAVVDSLAEVQKMREEWEEHQQAIERLQNELGTKPLGEPSL